MPTRPPPQRPRSPVAAATMPSPSWRVRGRGSGWGSDCLDAAAAVVTAAANPFSLLTTAEPGLMGWAGSEGGFVQRRRLKSPLCDASSTHFYACPGQSILSSLPEEPAGPLNRCWRISSAAPTRTRCPFQHLWGRRPCRPRGSQRGCHWGWAHCPQGVRRRRGAGCRVDEAI